MRRPQGDPHNHARHARAIIKIQQGWSLRATAPIRAGRFVCEYVGERISTAEAKARLQAYDALTPSPVAGGHALLVGAWAGGS